MTHGCKISTMTDTTSDRTWGLTTPDLIWGG